MPFDPTTATAEDEKPRGFDPGTAVLEAEPAPDQPGALRQGGRAFVRGATAEGIYSGLEGASRLAADAAAELTPSAIVLEKEEAALRDQNRRLENVIESQEGTFGGGPRAEDLPTIEANERRIAEIRRLRTQGKAESLPGQYAGMVRETRESIRQALPVDPAFERSLGGQIVSGFGQAAGTLPLYVIPGLGPGATMGQMYQQGYDDAKQSGADDATAMQAGLANLPAASLDVAADKLILGKVLRPLKGRMTVGQVARSVAAAGAAEGVTEAAQTAWQNVVASRLAGYDPERALDDEVVNSLLVGAVVGGGVTLGGQGASSAIARFDPGTAQPEAAATEATPAMQAKAATSAPPAPPVPVDSATNAGTETETETVTPEEQAETRARSARMIAALQAANATPEQLAALDRQLAGLEEKKAKRRLNADKVNVSLGNTFLGQGLPQTEYFAAVNWLAANARNIAELRAGIEALRSTPEMQQRIAATEEQATLQRQGEAAQRQAEEASRTERVRAESAELAAIEKTGRSRESGLIVDISKVPLEELQSLDLTNDSNRFLHDGDELTEEALQAELERRGREEERAAAAAPDRSQYSFEEFLERHPLPRTDAVLQGELDALAEEMTPQQRMRFFRRAQDGNLDSNVEAGRADFGFAGLETPADLIAYARRMLRGQKDYSQPRQDETFADPSRSGAVPTTGRGSSVAAMPAIPPGTPSGTHAENRMAVAMERILPGSVDVPTVMTSLEDVVRALGGESPIRVGRFYHKARGIFNPRTAVIRLKQGDNIPTAAHETAHALSAHVFQGAHSKQLIAALKTSPKGRAVEAELRKLGQKLYGSRIPAAGYEAEGFAELARLWLTTEDAGTAAPTAFAWFEQELLATNTPLADALKAARDKIDIWRGQGAEGRARAQMKDAPGRLQRLRDFARRKLTIAEHLEEFEPLQAMANGFERVSGTKLAPNENPYLLASAFRKGAGPALETMVQRGMIDLWGNVRGPALREAFARIKPQDAEKFAHYLWARRALERWAKNKNPGMPLEDAQYLREKLETPEFVDAAAKYYAWWDGVLQYLADASPATNGPLVEAIRANSHDYVPLARVLDPQQVKAVAAHGQGGGVYRMQGSSKPIKDIYQQSLLVAEKLIARAHRDLVVDSIINLSETEGMGWLAEKVPLTRVMETVSIEKIRSELESHGVDTSGIPEDTLLKYATHLDRPNGVDPIVARKNGFETEWYQIPADVYELLNGVEAPARLGWVFELLFGVPTRAFKMGTTGLRASFSLVTNPARDFSTFLLQSVAGNPASRAATWFKSLADVVRSGLGGKDSAALDLYNRLGISAANFVGGDIQQAKRESKALFRGRIYRKLASPVEAFRELLSITEATPRVAELELLSKELGWKPGQKLTPEQAVLLRLAAKRVTTDFSAAGKSGREINRAVPFYNAAVQGARSFARALKGDRDIGRAKRHATLRAILNGVALLTLPALANWWRNKDEEWYQTLPWRERYLYLNVAGDNGRLYQVPLPPEWGSLFATMPEALLNSWYTRDPAGVTESLSHVLEVVNPVDYPVLARAAKEQWSNRVEFFDRPIVPRGELDLRPGDQRSVYSSWLAKTLGDVFPETVSPRRVDAAVREVFGGAGADLVEAPTAFMRALGLQALEKERETEASDLPVFGRIARRGGQYSAANQALIDFWDDRDRYSAIANSHKKAVTEGRRSESNATFKELAYAKRLELSYPALRLTLEIAARTPELARRQELYRRAAQQAKRITATRPRE